MMENYKSIHTGEEIDNGVTIALNLSGISEDIDQINSEISRIDATLTEHTSNISDLQDNVSELNSALIDTNNEVDDLRTDISSIQSQVNIISDKFPIGTSDITDGAVTPGKLSENYALKTEGVLQIASNYFSPALDSTGRLYIPDVSLSQLNEYAELYAEGLYPVSSLQSVLTFKADRLYISQDIAYFDYSFTKINGDNIERYIVSITATEVASNTLRCDRTIYQISSIPVPFFVPYGSGTDAVIPIAGSRVSVVVSYKDVNSASISLIGDNIQTERIYRTSIYNGTPEGILISSMEITSSGIVIDDTVYTNFNDEVTIRIFITGHVYVCRLIIYSHVVGEFYHINA